MSSADRNMLYSVVVLLVVLCLNKSTSYAQDTTESLDAYICLRTNGFFPHDVRCDHFYECRNSTIINEGICKQGLRFDYRYRKKPRCIASDQIDCRITQVIETVPSNVYNAGGKDNRHSSSSTTLSAPADNVTIATTLSPKLITTTAAPFLFETTTLISAEKGEAAAFEATTTTRPPPNRIKVARKKSTPAINSRPKSQRTTLPPPTTTAAPTIATFTTTTTTTPPTPTTRVSFREEDYIERDRHHRVHNRHHDNDDHREQPVHETNRIDSAPGEGDDDSNGELALPARRRKVARKSVKLRRGRLQEQPVLGAGDTSLAGQHLRPAQHFHQPHSLMSRTIDADTPEAVVPESRPTSFSGRPQSAHCPAPSGYYADREDCRKFYACDDGRAFPMWCPLGLAYDEMTGTCAWPDMVEGCKSEEMLRFTCPEANENELLDYGDPRYPTNDCRKFVVCVVSEVYGNRTPRLLGCEEGLVFNPLTRTCDYQENVPQCANYYSSEALAQHHTHHHHRHQKRRVRL